MELKAILESAEAIFVRVSERYRMRANMTAHFTPRSLLELTGLARNP